MNIAFERLIELEEQVATLTAERDALKAQLVPGQVLWQVGRIPTPDLGPYDDRDEEAEREWYLIWMEGMVLDLGPLADHRAEGRLPLVLAWARVGTPNVSAEPVPA